MMTETNTKPWPKWGLALSLIAVLLSLFAWFFNWAAAEYHSCGGVSASLGFLYLPEYARNERSVYGAVAMSLQNRCLFCGAAEIPISIVALTLCAFSRPAARVISAIGFAIVLVLPLLFLRRIFLGE